MEKDELIRQRQASFRQTNAYAMQNGLILGLWAIGCQACYVLGLEHHVFSNIWLLMFLGIPVVTYILTLRFRKIVGLDVNFTFSRGFMHAFLTLMYAAVWASVATFIYMQFFDNGYIFDCFAKQLNAPETIKAMNESGLTQSIAESTGGRTPTEIINMLRTIGAGNWAAMIIYMYILSAPILAVIIGLFSMHRVHYKRQ